MLNTQELSYVAVITLLNILINNWALRDRPKCDNLRVIQLITTDTISNI